MRPEDFASCSQLRAIANCRSRRASAKYWRPEYCPEADYMPWRKRRPPALSHEPAPDTSQFPGPDPATLWYCQWIVRLDCSRQKLRPACPQFFAPGPDRYGDNEL